MKDLNQEEQNVIFQRSIPLLGVDGLETLSRACVAVFGLGGVGSYASEALARSGVGRLLLIDGDVVEASNINRQLYALYSTLGMPKAEIAAARARDINPAIAAEAHRLFYLPGVDMPFSFEGVDYIVDAVDTVTAKLALAETAKKLGVPIVSSMGAGNRLDPSRFEIADIFDTSVCPLCRVMRHELRKRGVDALSVVYSREEPRHVPEQGRTPASVAFVPPAAGLLLASKVVRDLTQIEENCNGR